MKPIKPKRPEIINEKMLIVAVDISKVKNTGYYRCPDGTDVKPFEFFNAGQGFNQFWEIITAVMRSRSLERVLVGFESTGPYAEPLMHDLRKRGAELVQVNPMHTKRLKELQGNSPNKTDQKDPKVIADIIELGHALTVVIPEGAAAELRRGTAARERSVHRRTALYNQLQDLVFIIFPELVQIMKDIKSQSAHYLLKHAPTPEDIVRLGPEALARLLQKVSRGRRGRLQAEPLYQAARETVGIGEGRFSVVREIGELLSLIEASNRFIAELEEQMRQDLQAIPYSRFLLSIKGVGEITVAALIGEVGDFRKFRTIGELLKHGGLDLYEISSGQRRGPCRISKRGRPLMRKLLFFAAINVVRKGGILHERYQRYLTKGMLKMKALIAIARKLLGIMLALVRDHSEYVVGYVKAQPVLKAA